MNSSDNKTVGKFEAETLNGEMEIVELCVDEQAHVAGGAIDSFLKFGFTKGE